MAIVSSRAAAARPSSSLRVTPVRALRSPAPTRSAVREIASRSAVRGRATAPAMTLPRPTPNPMATRTRVRSWGSMNIVNAATATAAPVTTTAA